MTIREGWKCPRCEAINAPDVRKCDCAPKAKAAEPSVLEQFAELARQNERLRERPVYVPYPYPVPSIPLVQPAPYWWRAGEITWSDNTPTFTYGNTTNKPLLSGD